MALSTPSREWLGDSVADKSSFYKWVCESSAPEAMAWRLANLACERARRIEQEAVKAARAAYIELGRPDAGPSDGAIAKAEARS